MLVSRWKLIVTGVGIVFATGAMRVLAEPAPPPSKLPTASAPAPKPAKPKRAEAATQGAQGAHAPAPAEAAADKKRKKRGKASDEAKQANPTVAPPQPPAAAPLQPTAAAPAVATAAVVSKPAAATAPVKPGKPTPTCSLVEAEQPRGGRLDVVGAGFGQAPLVRVAGKPVRMLERRDDRISVQVPADSDGGDVSLQSDGRSTGCGKLVIIGKNR